MTSHHLDLTLATAQSSRAGRYPVSALIIAGWTGRDKVALEKHIKELEELGVARPASTPIYYRVAATRATTAARIEAAGATSSGEVEFVLAQWQGRLWVGVGSDHTDRQVETYNVTVSKQMCEKPIASEFWSFDEVVAHWDQIRMRSYIHENGSRVLYQEGTMAGILDPVSLIRGFSEAGALPDGAMMFCGTFAAKGGIRPAARFEFELEDPVRGRSIRHGYDIETLPVLG
jgi:hypothetical protein